MRRLGASRICSFGLIAVAAFAGASGCAQVGVSELSEAPIAFVYHTEEAARRRAESLAEKKAEQRDRRSAAENRGVVNVNAFREYLDGIYGQKADQKYRGRLALLDARTTEVTVIVGSQLGAIPQSWSPDHRRLLFSQGDPGYLQLFEFDLESKEVRQLTRGPESHPQGCFASDGRTVVTVFRTERRRHHTSQLAILSPAGEIEMISSGPSDGDPTCSRDGLKVAFVRAFGAAPQIWVQPLTPGAAAYPVTPGRDPSFSPDGEWIVFGRGYQKTSQLWRVRADGAGRTRLGIGSGAEEYRPVVSPDGGLIVYESVLDNRTRLFMRRFDGTGDMVLFSTGDGTHAVW